MKTSLLAVFDYVQDFLATISDALKFDYLMWVFLGIFGLLVIMTLIRLRFTYEVRAIKSFKKINKYFLKKPYINESNLVEFNRLMKKIPYQLRDRWQYFMLNRAGLPSDEMTLYHCVEQPIKTSNYRSTIVMLKYVSNICFAVCLILSLFAIGANAMLTPAGLVSGLIIPVIFFVLCQLYIYFLNAKFNANSVDLYEYYLSFIRNLDKASASIPDYVDYELLFTDKEIRDGIPVLREYLEKRALLDKIAREKAKEAESEREEFDFRALGIDGSLLVERAMTTSQDFINSRNKLKDEITKLETQKEKYTEHYISVEKDNQRKLQTIKENLARLQGQLEASANRIESNYIKKQQDQEKAKQAEIEKNLEDLNVKYAQQTKFLETEIENRRKEIEQDKLSVSEQMDAEFNTYNEKVYTILRNKIDQDDSGALKVTRAELDETRDKLETETQNKENLALTLEVRQQEIDTLNSSIEALNDKIAKLTSKDRKNIAKMYDENIELKKRVEELESQLQSGIVVDKQVQVEESDEVTYFDAEGNPVDFTQYYDEEGKFKEFPKVYDKDGNYYDFADYYDVYGNPLNGEEDGDADEGNGEAVVPAVEVEQQPAEEVEEVVAQELPMEEDVEAQIQESQQIDDAEILEVQPVEEQVEEIVEDPVQEEIVEEQQTEEEEEIVYYDAEGNVVDFDQFYDEEGKFKEFPKVYDKDGNYYDFADYYDRDGNLLEDSDNVEEKVQENVEEQPIEEIENDDTDDDDDDDGEVVYYDAEGNVVDFDQFYDEEGRFKEFPKVYDKHGNYYDFADYYDRDGNLLEGYVTADEEVVSLDENEPEEALNIVAEDPQVVVPVQENEVKEDPAKKKRGRPKKVDSDEDGEKKPVKRKMKRVSEPKNEDATTKKTAKKSSASEDGKKKTKKSSTSTKKSSTAKKSISTNKADGAKKKTGKKTTAEKKETSKPVTKKSTAKKVEEKTTSTSKKSTASSKKTATTKKDTAKKTQSTKKSNVAKSRAKTKKNDEDLDVIAGQINSESEKLEKKQADLKNKITKTLSELNEKPSVDRDLEEIKDIIKKLKEQASEVNKGTNGLNEEEKKDINKQINKSLSELLLLMSNKSKK